MHSTKKARPFVEMGETELRRTVGASGRQPLDILHDIANAARALKEDKAGEKMVEVVLHGNKAGVSRELVGDELKNTLTASMLGAVQDYRKEIARLQNLHKDDLKKAKAAGDVEEVAFLKEDTQRLIDEYTRMNPKIRALSGALDEVASAFKEADVGALEIQACNTGGSEGLDSYSFVPRLEALLKVDDHKVRVRAHRETILSGRDPQSGKMTVWLGNEESRLKVGSQQSTTTLPPMTGR